MSRIVFFPTIESHLDNFEPVMNELSFIKGVDPLMVFVPSLTSRLFKPKLTKSTLTIVSTEIEKIIDRLNEVVFCLEGGVLVVGNDSGINTKRIIREARKNKYRIVLLQDGWLESQNINRPIRYQTPLWKFIVKYIIAGNWSPFKNFVGGFISQNVDYCFVYSKNAREEFIKAKVKKHKIRITGSPRHHVLKENKITTSSSNINFVFFSTLASDEKDHESIINSFLWVKEMLKCTQKDNYTLWIKCHPREEVSPYVKYVSDKIKIFKKTTPELFKVMEVKFSFCFNSTVILELLMKEIPFLQIVPESRKITDANYIQELPIIHDKKELFEVFEARNIPINYYLRKKILADLDKSYNSVKEVSCQLIKILNV
jgi:hypothetical protein